MNQKKRALLFILLTFALMMPYLAFVEHFALRYPSGHWPDWLTNTLLAWFITNFLILFLAIRLINRRATPSGPKDLETAHALQARTIARSVWLVIVWSALFLYGTEQTIRGEIPLKRAVPAGAFLLVFIGIFGWSIYRSKHPARSDNETPNP